MTKILGIHFFEGDEKAIFDKLNLNGGLLTAPSGPGLANIPNDKVYYESLINSDIVIPDSGYMVMIWNLISAKKIKRLSGLKLINTFLDEFSVIVDDNILLINPSQDEENANIALLNSKGFKVTKENSYIAPLYSNSITDHQLLHMIETQKPKWILINIGGGVQEILGSYLKQNLNYKPAIICTGAAIAFKTGKQVKIPNWADQLFLGWLVRILSNPSIYLPRYLASFKLFFLLFKFKEKEFFKTSKSH